MEKEVFVLIRLIDMVEKCAQLSQDRISSEEHHKQISKLLDRFNTIKAMVPNFELMNFVNVTMLLKTSNTIWRIADSESIG